MGSHAPATHADRALPDRQSWTQVLRSASHTVPSGHSAAQWTGAHTPSTHSIWGRWRHSLAPPHDHGQEARSQGNEGGGPSHFSRPNTNSRIARKSLISNLPFDDSRARPKLEPAQPRRFHQRPPRSCSRSGSGGGQARPLPDAPGVAQCAIEPASPNTVLSATGPESALRSMKQLVTGDGVVPSLHSIRPSATNRTDCAEAVLGHCSARHQTEPLSRPPFAMRAGLPECLGWAGSAARS